MTNTCSVQDCGRPTKTGKCTYCDAHYNRLRLYGDLRANTPVRTFLSRKQEISPENLWCSVCKTEKPDEEISSAAYLRSTGRRTGQCKSCRNKIHLETRPDLRAKYGLDSREYDRLLSSQDGVCFICKKLPGRKQLAVDHDHSCCPGEYTCGKCIRGLLCPTCNTRIEWSVRYRDKVEEYLNRGPTGIQDPEE